MTNCDVEVDFDAPIDYVEESQKPEDVNVILKAEYSKKGEFVKDHF